MPESIDTMSESVLYDIFNMNCVEDIEMYKKMCSDVSQVLELGIGTGRLAIPLAQTGVHVVGIDNSLEMLSELENKIRVRKVKGITYYEQDMRSISLRSQFDLILCPFCAFNFLLSIDDQRKALLSIREHLKTTGKIVFDLLTINTFNGFFQQDLLQHFDSYACPDEDATIEIYTISKFNQSNQIYTQDRIFRKYIHNILTTERHTVMRNRLCLLGEFQLLLEQCGLKILDIYGDCKLSPFSQSSQNLFVVVAIR